MDKEKKQTLHVFVVGNDDSVFDFSSPLFQKVSLYAKTLGRLTILCRTRKVVTKLPITRGPLTIYAVRSSNPLTFIIRAFVLGRRIINSNIEAFRVITSDNPFEEGLAAWILARAFHLPLQLQVHTDVMSPFFRQASWKEYIRYILARFLIPRADCARVVSRRIKNSILRKLGFFKADRLAKVVVLPIFTDISKLIKAVPDPSVEACFKEYGFKMIAVGRLVDKEKNFGMLIDLMRDFVKIYPAAILVLVGEGPDRKKYQKKIVTNGLDKNVILAGWRNDLPAFYKSFDLFLFPSNYEGWGRAVIEAMAAGLSVVMTDVGLAG